MGGMPVRRNPVDEATRRARHQVHEAVGELRSARLSAGLSQGSVAAAVGCSRQLIGAIEAGKLEDVGCIQLARIAAVVGMDVTTRAFASGSPLRDAGQLRLLQRFRSIVGAAWTWRTEVPVSDEPLDRRAFDAVLSDGSDRVGVECITRLTDAQGQVRSILLKQVAGRLGRVVLVLSDTRYNRSVVRSAAPTLDPAFPLSQRRLIRELEAGRLPSANGIVLL
jgi:transcriptional regulator with XRE-family HTH domain